MKRMKRLAAFLLLAVMLAQMLPVIAFASDEAEKTMAITLNRAWGMPGDEVEVDVTISDNPGFAALVFDVYYDNALTLTNVTFNPEMEGIVSPGTDYTQDFVSPQRLAVINYSENISLNGVFATLTFKVSEDAEDFHVSNITIAYEPKNVTDINRNPISLKVTSGKVDIYHGIPGDVDADGRLTGADPVLLFRHIAGWDVDVDNTALDFDGDNDVSIWDAITLFRYVSGWEEGITPSRGPITHAHDFTYVEAKPVSCTEDGNVAHWHCSSCNKNYADVNGDKELDTVIVSALGHIEVIDAPVAPTDDSTGLTEGSHCSVCGEVIIAQEIVDKLQSLQHSVTYHDCKGIEISAEYWRYAEHSGMELPIIEVPGYRFVGWCETKQHSIYNDKEVPNDLVTIDHIPAGSTKDYRLYAHWAIITYNIHYNVGGGVGAQHNNPSTYTVEDEIILSEGFWLGLDFAYWEDTNEQRIDRIKRGTTGNLELTSVWRERENLIIPADEDRELVWVNDFEFNRVYLIYPLGMVKNIVLERAFIRENVGMDIVKSETYTTTFNQSIAETVGLTVSNSISNSIGWNFAYSKTKTHSEDIGAEISAELSAGVEGVATAKIGSKISATESDTMTTNKEFALSGNNTTVNDTTESAATTTEYEAGKTVSVQITETMDGSAMPLGYYEWVTACNTNVYAVVTYDYNTNLYYLDVYNKVVKTLDTVLYTPPYEMDLKILKDNILDYDIDMAALMQRVESDGRTIKYELNGGAFIEDKSDVLEVNKHFYPTFYLADGTDIVISNELVYPGYPLYTFEGWYEDEALTVPFVNDLGNNPRNITLYAKWNRSETYKTIADTPSELTAERVFIDLRAESVLDLGSRIIDIHNTVKAVHITGDAQKVYSNLAFNLIGFAEDQQLDITFDNFNLDTHQSSAFTLTDCGNMNLRLSVAGESSITTSAIGGSAINISTSDLEICGTGSLTLKGAKGATGATGEKGAAGGAAIIAGTVRITEYASLTAVGGDGGTGGIGKTGAAGSGTKYYAGYYKYNSNYTGDYAHSGFEYRGNNGGVGGTGGQGGDGAVAIQTDRFVILSAGSITLISGNGGDGGQGGTGGQGANGATGNGGREYRYDVQNGGKGGTGGQGGTGGIGGFAPETVSSCAIEQSNPLATVTTQDGERGNGGRGGTGGQGGNGGDGGTNTDNSLFGWGDASATANGGARGDGGAGGAGGEGKVNGATGATGAVGAKFGLGGMLKWCWSSGTVRHIYYGLNGDGTKRTS